jgi:2-polyprenyl-6-methoxyphenol hydroxylase-like FAD-dependent oxidoreductase
MLGLLLARSGVEVLVLEKHRDFLRDFRGDTLHPSTLEVMHELGPLEELLKLPHEKTPCLRGQVGDLELTVADFRRLSVRCPYIAMMPQWDFLDFLERSASRYPTFACLMGAEVRELTQQDGRITGLRASTSQGDMTVRADLVVGADGRRSVVRRQAGLPVKDFGAAIDVLWFRLSRESADPAATTGRFDAGRIFVQIRRERHWQCAYVIPKGYAERVHAQGLPAFRAAIAEFMPFAAERLGEISTWDDVKLLSVGVERLVRWSRPGLLCIGDAAHTMSPVGGVGINLAIQDAVAAANLLAGPLKVGALTDRDLARVQRRREFPADMTQRVQVAFQNRFMLRVLRASEPQRPPTAMRLLARSARLQRLTARMVGVGVRPEHVRLENVTMPPASLPRERLAVA